MIKYIRIYTLLPMLVFCSFAKGQNKTHFRDSDTTINGVRIENGLPKGGGHTDSKGKRFGFALLWTRVINETSTPLELKINFPADSFALPTPDSYLKLLLLPDSIYYSEYDSKGLNSFLDTGINKPTTLQRTIHPNEECLFYIGFVSYKFGCMVRAGLVLKDQELFYKMSIIPHFNSVLFPCGRITFKGDNELSPLSQHIYGCL